MSALRLLAAAAVFVALLLLALANTEPVTLRIYNLAEREAPLAFVVFVAFAVGVGCGLAAGAMRAARLKRQLTKLRHEVRAGPRTPGPHGALPAASRPPRDAI